MTFSKEETIRRIISLEERISQCRRCNSLIKCTAKPSTGKGELKPEIMLVFESETMLTIDSGKMIELRKFIQNVFKIQHIYHSFLVRCHPKICSMRKVFETYANPPFESYIDKNNICLLKQEPCNGILTRSTDEELVFCLPYLLEEIEILCPQFVFLIGQKTAEFVLKSYGFLNEISSNGEYEKDGMVFIIVRSIEEFFTSGQLLSEECIS